MPNEVSGNFVTDIGFAAATRIMQFNASSADRFRNQVIFINSLISEGVYPSVRVIALKRASAAASFEYLIVITGSRSDYLRRIDSRKEDEVFERVLPGKSNADLWSDGVIMDTPHQPGTHISDMQQFVTLRREIEHGLYSIHEVLQ